MATVMYVKPGCPYCQAAREDLTARGEPFQEKDATKDPFWKRELMRHTRGTGVVPTIVRTNGGVEVQVGFPPGRG
jgi:glutaredoxin 3